MGTGVAAGQIQFGSNKSVSSQASPTVCKAVLIRESVLQESITRFSKV
jgi:hypothetical protein